MHDSRRSPRTLLVYTLAVPVIVAAYITAFGGRMWAALRPLVATILGATVIGSIYADEALKRAPATPMRAAVLALAIALVGPGLAPAPTLAARDPADAVIAAARQYLGSRYRLGTEGPGTFDCSGLIFRAFADAGELPRIGGMRLRAAGYMRWFVSRGLFTKSEDEARPGDLVVWANGEHAGIYLGDGMALSALVNPHGVSIHSLYGINQPVSYFLQVNWRNGDGDGGDDKPDNGKPGNDKPGNDTDPPRGDGDGNGSGNGNGDSNNGNNNGNGNGVKPDRNNPPADPKPANDRPNADRNHRHGITTGTLNLREAADPSARIIGWVGRGVTFNLVAEGTSPAGWLWYQIETSTGKKGWIFAHWTRVIE